MGTQWGGLGLIVAAATFWVGWLLMPDAGTNDGAVVAGTGHGRRAIALAVLGVVGLGYGWVGWEFVTSGPNRKTSAEPAAAPDPAARSASGDV